MWGGFQEVSRHQEVISIEHNSDKSGFINCGKSQLLTGNKEYCLLFTNKFDIQTCVSQHVLTDGGIYGYK